MIPGKKPRRASSAKALTYAAYAAFLPIGVATVLLGPMLPTLSTRWSLNYSQAGALFTVQFLSSTVAVALSGVMVARWGFRFAIKTGLLVMAAGVALLLTGPKALGLACIAAYGAGLGLAVPAANLVVAEVNPERRSASLNVLNFCWSVGAVACPFLVAAAVKNHKIVFLLGVVAGSALLVAGAIAAMPSSIVEPTVARRANGGGGILQSIDWKHRALPGLAALFFVYVGTENAFGGWVASYAKSLGTLSVTLSVMTPSFFYGALTVGRWIAPFVLRAVDEVRLAKAGILVSCAGMGMLLFAHSFAGIVLSASLAGLGLASVYPITISMLSREFGSAAARTGSLMFTVANLGGASLPWLVGVSSSRLGTLKAGLAVPLIGGAVLFALYLRAWAPTTSEQLAQ